ncbi:MAG: hypothetical protein ACRDHZ_18855 [Ktedonobacteraceae bacterium]
MDIQESEMDANEEVVVVDDGATGVELEDTSVDEQSIGQLILPYKQLDKWSQ